MPNPMEAPVTEYLHNKAARMGIPLNGTFELTPLCNMDCRMCYIRLTPQQQAAIRPLRTAKEWISLAETARAKGMLYLLLTGGEPFLRPDFREILSALHHMGLLISINSNGTLIDKDVVSWLRETPPLRVNLTLYGASNETYARLCRNPNGFTQAVNAIHLLKEAGIGVKLNCSVTPYNAGDLEQIFEFANREGLVLQATSYMFPPLRRDRNLVGQNDRFSPEEAAYQAARIEYLSGGKENFLRRLERQDFGTLPVDTEEACSETEGDGIWCRAGKCSFWVTWDGRLLPCGMLPLQGAADVFSVGFEEAWRRAAALAKEIRLPGQCKECGMKTQCRACAAMVLTETGTFHSVPDYRCRMSCAYPEAYRRFGAALTANAENREEGEYEKQKT